MAGEEFLAWLASFQPHPRYWSLLYFLTIGSEPATIQHHPALHHLHHDIVLDRSTFVPASYCCLALFPYRKGFCRSQILLTPVLPARSRSPYLNITTFSSPSRPSSRRIFTTLIGLDLVDGLISFAGIPPSFWFSQFLSRLRRA